MSTTGTPARPAGEDAPVGLHVWSGPAEGAWRNVFAVETPHGLVAVDAPLRRSDGLAAGHWLGALGKPLLGVLITHAHPDHNFGLTRMLAGQDVPIHATAAVAEGIAADEDLMQRLVPINFGHDETEDDRRFPDQLVESGVPLTIDGVEFVARDVGEVESAADSVWTTPALPRHVFAGDLVMHRIHLGLLQGRTARYLAALQQLDRDADDDTVFLTGHGALATRRSIPAQIAYIEAYRAAVRDLAQGRDSLTDEEKAALTRRVLAVEPSPVLQFLIAMSADGVARELAGDPPP